MAAIDSELEGPVRGIPLLNGNVVTMTVNGVPVRVPATTPDPDTNLPVPLPIRTPTGRISLAQLANAAVFPGRKRRNATGQLEDIPGFDDATAIVEGTFETNPMQPFPNILVATAIEIEPAENLLLGAVTGLNPLRINGTEVREINDPVGRMNFGGYKNEFGFKVTPTDPRLIGTLASAEGYFADGFFFAHTVEVDALAPVVAGQPPVSITRARTRRRAGGPATVDIRGGINTAGTGVTTFRVGVNRFDRDLTVNPPVDSNDILIGVVTPVMDGVFTNFGLWRLSGPLSQPSQGADAGQPFPLTAPRYIRVIASLPFPTDAAEEEADVRF